MRMRTRTSVAPLRRREEREADLERAARSRCHARTRRRRPADPGATRRIPPLLRARSRSHQALAPVAPVGRQVPGVHRTGRRPRADAPHARRRGGAGRDGHRARVSLVGVADRGDRARARLWPRPAGHASEDAFTPYLPGGYDHAVYGADVTLAELNLCRERSTACATTRGGAPRRRLRRARSSPGPTGSPTSATTSRMRCARASSRPTTFRTKSRRCRRHPVRAARRVHGGGARGGGRTGSIGHDRAGRIGARDLPGVQLRTDLPAPGRAPAGRQGRRPVARPRRPLRRLARAHHERRRPRTRLARRGGRTRCTT
jgi:hypothetical protein